jgi:CRP-like cAMP-binding protein
MTPLRFPAGKVLTRLDDVGQEFFVIITGEARVMRGEQRLAHLGPGSFFGEMALLDGGKRSATVVTDTAVEVFVLSEREFADLLRQSQTVGQNMLRIMSQRLRAA